MSKQDRAAQAIEHATKRGYSPEQTARLLSKFNLLAPDMPCLLYTSPSPRDQRGSRMPSSA